MMRHTTCLSLLNTRQLVALFFFLHSGRAIAFSSDAAWLAVGAPYYSASVGATFIFHYDDGTASYQYYQKLQAYDASDVSEQGEGIFSKPWILFFLLLSIHRHIMFLAFTPSCISWFFFLPLIQVQPLLSPRMPHGSQLEHQKNDGELGATFIFRYDQATASYVQHQSKLQANDAIGFFISR